MLRRMYVCWRCRRPPDAFIGTWSAKSRRHLSDVKSPTQDVVTTTGVVDNNFVKRKLNELVIWYEQVTGMDEVRLVQNRVIEAQDRFVSAQENRRNLASQLIDIQNKLKEVQAELNTVSRGEERYLLLVTEEHRILKEVKQIESIFLIYERDERDSFNMLSSRLKESHEKERSQANRTKYWSIIGSIVGTILGFAGSSINNELKMKELRKLVWDSTEAINSNRSIISAASIQELSSLLTDVRDTFKLNSSSLYQVNNTYKKADFAQQMSKIENHVDDLKRLMDANRRVDGRLVVVPSDLEFLLERQKVDIRNLIIGSSILVLVIPIVFSIIVR